MQNKKKLVNLEAIKEHKKNQKENWDKFLKLLL